MKKLIITNFDANGSKVKNLISVLKMKKLKKIVLEGHPEVYPTKDLIKINKILKKPALAFFNQCKKKNSKIKNKYDLEGNDWKKYQKLDKEIEFGYGSSDTAEEILKNRKNKS